MSGATATGALHASSVPVTIALAPRHRAALAKAAARGHGLTPARFNRRFAPSAAPVRRWARNHWLKVSSVSANRLLVRVTGSSAAVGRAFRTSLRTFKAPDGSTFFAPGKAARLTGALRGRTTSVLGLSNLGRVGFSPLVRKGTSIAPVAVPPVHLPPIRVPRVAGVGAGLLRPGRHRVAV